MADGTPPGMAGPAVTAAGSGTHPDPARRRIMRAIFVLVPMVVPAIMGAVVMLILR